MFFRSFQGAVGRVTILLCLFVLFGCLSVITSNWLIDSGVADNAVRYWYALGGFIENQWVVLVSDLRDLWHWSIGR